MSRESVRALRTLPLTNCVQCVHLPFLAAMSISRSDDVTQFVCLSVTFFSLDFFSVFRVIQSITGVQECSRGASGMFQQCFKDVQKLFQKVFLKEFRKRCQKVFQNCLKNVSIFVAECREISAPPPLCVLHTFTNKIL